jgi:hypothetical protein
MTRADARPVYYLRVSASNTVDFEFLSGLCDAGDLQDLPISIVSVSSISQEIDPVTRKNSIGVVEVKLAMDPNTQSMLSGYRLKGKRCLIRVGEKTLGSSTAFQTIFTGYIDESIGNRETLTLTIASPVVRIKDYKIRSWQVLNKHPLEAIEDLLGLAGVPSADIETSSFDPDTDTAISHFCVSRGRGYLSDQDNSIQGETAANVIEQLCELMVGGLIARENGKIEFKRFNISPAAVAVFDDNNIIDIEVLSTYEYVINSVAVDIAPQQPLKWAHPAWPGDNGLGSSAAPAGGQYTQRDAVAAAALGDDTTPYIVEHVVSNPWIAGVMLSTGSPSYPDHTPPGQQAYPQYNAAATTLNFHNGHIHGVSGMRDSWPTASQPAGAKISAGRPIYIKLQTGEVISSTNFAPSASASMLIEPATVGGARSSAKATATVTRAQLGTSAIAPKASDTISPNLAQGDSFGFQRWEVPAYDITIARFIAEQLIERFAYGAPVLKVRTTAEQYAVQVGDFVTVNSGELLGFSIEMTSGKWEVVKKEDDLLSDSPGIVWTLVKAERFGAAIDRVFIANIPDYIATARMRGNISQAISAKAVIEGFSPNSISGLNIKFDPGTLAAQGVILPSTLIDLDLTASKFNYLAVDLLSSLPVLYTANSALPLQESAAVTTLRGIETDGSGILSQDDYRNPTTILGNVVRDATLGPAHQNLLADTRSLAANSDFNIWSLPRTVATQPPDNWQSVIDLGAGYVASPASWGAAVRADTDADVGAYSIRIETDTDPSAISLKQQIPITPDQIYLLEVKVKKSDAAGYFDLVAFYTDGTEIEGDLALAVSDTTTTAGAWEVLRYTFRAQPTAGKKFLNIVFGHQATAGAYLIDYLRVEPVGSAVLAYRSTSQSIPNTTDTTLVFNTVTHDDGDEFDTATGLFTASAAGDYSVSACVTLGLLSGDNFVQIRLVINGAQSHQGQYITAGGTNRGIQATVSAAAVRLEAGDTLGVSVYRSSSATITTQNENVNRNYIYIKRIGD